MKTPVLTRTPGTGLDSDRPCHIRDMSKDLFDEKRGIRRKMTLGDDDDDEDDVLVPNRRASTHRMRQSFAPRPNS